VKAESETPCHFGSRSKQLEIEAAARSDSGPSAQRQASEIKIFAGKPSTSPARQIFHQLFHFSGRFWDSIARPAESLAAKANIRPQRQFAGCEMNFIRELEIVSVMRPF
jgi:hypothetical protein